MAEALFNKHGESFPLGQKLAAGGEGSIYLFKSKHVIKKYHDSSSTKKLTSLEHKLAFMLNNRPRPPLDVEHSFWTWPEELLYNNSGFAGYLMPKLEGVKGEEFIQFSSGFSWKERLEAALYLVKAVKATHVAGYVVGDLNPRNLFFVEGSPVLPTLTDTDSFQVQTSDGEILFPCTVQNPEYSAPELINAISVDRTFEQDFFTLAIVVFQILSLGLHPFLVTSSDNQNREIKDNIAKGLSVFSKNVTKPKHMIDLAVFSDDLLVLFKKMFGIGLTVTKSRPQLAVWQHSLEQELAGLKICGSTASHYYGGHLEDCPWCDYKQKIADPFDPRLKAYKEAPKKRLEAKIIGSKDVVMPFSGVREVAVPDDVGNNTFFGPIPDSLRPDHLPTNKQDPYVEANEAKKSKKPAIWLGFGLVLILIGGAAYFAFPYLLPFMQNQFSHIQARFDQPQENEITDSTTDVPEVLDLSSSSSSQLVSLRVEFCLDADSQEPYTCVDARELSRMPSMSLQGTRETVALAAISPLAKEANMIESGLYELIINDSAVPNPRCPISQAYLNPTGRRVALNLNADAVISFIYCEY